MLIKLSGLRVLEVLRRRII